VYTTKNGKRCISGVIHGKNPIKYEDGKEMPQKYSDIKITEFSMFIQGKDKNGEIMSVWGINKYLSWLACEKSREEFFKILEKMCVFLVLGGIITEDEFHSLTQEVVNGSVVKKQIPTQRFSDEQLSKYLEEFLNKLFNVPVFIGFYEEQKRMPSGTLAWVKRLRLFGSLKHRDRFGNIIVPKLNVLRIPLNTTEDVAYQQPQHTVTPDDEVPF